MGFNPVNGMAETIENFDVRVVLMDALRCGGVNTIPGCDFAFYFSGSAVEEIFFIPGNPFCKIRFHDRMAKGNPVVEKMYLFGFRHADLGMLCQDMTKPGGPGFRSADTDEIDFKSWVQF